MAPPTYFFPSVTDKQMVTDGKLDPKFLARHDLLAAFADLGPVAEDFFTPLVTATGPGGHAGMLFMALPASGEKPERLGYYPNLQIWEEVEQNGQTFWVGTDKEEPIRSVDLARKAVIPGYTCELPGGVWSIPVIRNPEGGTTLPKDWRWNGDGEVTEIVQSAYRKLWGEFAGVVDLYFGENADDPAGVFTIPPAEAMLRCAQVLGVNYRFGRVEQNLMGVIGSTTWSTILNCAIDLLTFWDAFEATQKKRGGEDQGPKDESPDTSPGPPDDSPDTGLAELS